MGKLFKQILNKMPAGSQGANQRILDSNMKVVGSGLLGSIKDQHLYKKKRKDIFGDSPTIMSPTLGGNSGG